MNSARRGYLEHAATLVPDHNIVIVTAGKANGEQTAGRAFHVIH